MRKPLPTRLVLLGAGIVTTVALLLGFAVKATELHDRLEAAGTPGLSSKGGK